MKTKQPISTSKKILLFVFLIFMLLFGFGSFYVNDYYHATETAKAALCDSETVSVTYLSKDVLAFVPKEPSAGLIFYPGGKVEYTAYAPLMHELAKNGILCILPHMTFNLAVLEMNAADGLSSFYPEIETWYIGGHSLGGSMAASYLEKNADSFDGLLLCASYSTADLSTLDIDVFSIYGSNDLVLNAEKYEESKSNLPTDYKEFVIEGGCHAYFGSYGAQEGDGTPTLTEAKQLELTLSFLLEHLK